MNNDYYQQHAERFFTETVTVDMSALYQPFVAHLKPGVRILDAGCGSGRDARAFHEMGYDVEAFDASAELVALARQHSGLPVEQKRFEEVTEVERYDGIWCCASLLHVPLAELPEVMSRLARALKPDGVWYLSFKYGSGEREKDGRVFTDMDEPGLKALVRGLAGIEVVEMWQTGDQRPGRAEEGWLNVTMNKNHNARC
ncbi:class I SAM-dependent methyltransferase [Pantoea agglomerans]|uniref:Class I SAM-dependent methyltransferase n=1 Tax=Enterobacter agglomerans TaxID=549 RepID=A0ACC5RNU2_ENTAG|nr:class I SAM-dependent methyltransferase [Pantoea agglomerans]MBK4726355.1 class I SAM-dependent methyltransferase [Pantoea agglomerans]